MYHGIISSESLTNPVVLNSYKKKNVLVESMPLSDTPYWHIFVLELSDSEVEKAADDISKVTKPEWYGIFWNDKTVYVALQNKVFELKHEKDWKSPEYEEMVQYARAHGVAEEYLDFNVNFEEYEKVVKG